MNLSVNPSNDNRYRDALYLDLEWTCWDATPPMGMKQEIIEIGIVAMNLNELTIIDQASYFVRPRRWEISLKCMQLTGITHEDILGAKSLSEVLRILTERFQPKGRACYTWGEDIPRLVQACSSGGLTSPFGRAIDLSKVFQDAFAAKDRIGLKAGTEMLGLNFDGFQHGALPDARNTALIHASILQRLRCEPKEIGNALPLKGSDLSPSPFAQKLSACLK